MRAIIIKEFGSLDNMVIETVPDPEPKVGGHAVIEVKAFGINHVETCEDSAPVHPDSSRGFGTIFGID
jgi:NADPH:quinone reductase-like Zn-dependent oxidoreductase